MTGATEIPQRGFIRPDPGETPVISRVLPLHIPIRSRSILEIIRFAAANLLCIDLVYDNSVRRIEPYSLRQTAEGSFVLHAIRSDSGEHRSYRVDRIRDTTVTSQVFTPRYTVELTSTGPLLCRRCMTTALSRRSSASAARGPTYVFRCPICRKNRTGNRYP
jgi:hypothetical protein